MSVLRPMPRLPARDEHPAFDAADLVGATGQAKIVLGEQVYTLRLTRAGKLILTK